jgi:hypothetical protein
MDRFCFFRTAMWLVLVVGHSVSAYGSIIDAYPDPIFDGTFGVYSPLGEVSRTNPASSISPRHDFATYFGQSFVALPGLAHTLTVDIGNSQLAEGIDFKVLVALTNLVSGVWQPTDVIHESGIFTKGTHAGASGTSVGTGSGREDITVSLGDIDLIDGQTYSWVIDTVTTADGIEGYGVIGYRHPDQPDFPGNSSVLVYDLETNSPNQPWINVSYIDLAYRMEFVNGGVTNPVHEVIRTLPDLPDSMSGGVPELTSLAIWSLLGLVSAGAGFKHRKGILPALIEQGRQDLGRGSYTNKGVRNRFGMVPDTFV